MVCFNNAADWIFDRRFGGHSTMIPYFLFNTGRQRAPERLHIQASIPLATHHTLEKLQHCMLGIDENRVACSRLECYTSDDNALQLLTHAY